MPIRKSDYPPDWDAISLEVRTEAGWMCEWCGAPGGKVIRRLGRVEVQELHIGCSMRTQLYRVDWERVFLIISAPGSNIEERVNEMSWKRLRFHGLTKIILSVAHLDRDSKNNTRENLAALCQRCHLRHDIWQHIANRKYGRLHAKEQQAKLEL